METIPLKTQRAHDIASLHIQGIGTGFISSLGINFVTALYEAISQSRTSFGYTIEEDGRVLGFVTFTTNLNKLYKSVIASKGLRFAFLLAGKMFSLKRLKRIFETLLYPNRVKNMDLASAELLSIVVSPEAYRTGLGSRLVRKGLEQCLEMGHERVKVLVGAENEPANRLYQKCGFEFVSQMENHGVKSNLYEAQVSKALSENFEREEPVTHYIERPAVVAEPEPVIVGFDQSSANKAHRRLSA
ncbi:MAG: GNAT family N-acetyltransferase [Planctomycetota bacterium]|jgi:ribosomal protein S18 acetylase RimI-like enzyme